MTDLYATVLGGLLSPDTAQRRTAEQQLESWKTNTDYGLNLTEIIVGVGHSRPLEQRHLCCTLLKQYVENRWSPKSEKFTPPEPSIEIKAKVRKILPVCLKDGQSAIRIGGAYAIAAIARYDWPDNWPNLFDLVGSALKSNNRYLVDGAICLCSELVNSLTEEQMKNMEHLLLPELLNICAQGEVFTVEIRSRAVSIFSSITTLVYNMNKSDARAGHRVAYYYYLHRFSDVFFNILSSPEGAPLSATTLKTETVKACALVVEKFPKQTQQFVPRILPIFGTMLEQSSQHYTRLVVEGVEDEESLNSETLDQLVYSLMELLHAVVNERRHTQLIVGAIPRLVLLVLKLIQIPQEKVEEWSNDVQRYVEEEDMDMSVNSVRLSAIELLITLCDSLPAETISALCSVVLLQVEESKGCKESGNAHWWKIREACYTAMGSVASKLLQVLQDASFTGFDLVTFVMTTLLPDMTNSGPVFLQGHAISFSGRIASALGPFVLQSLMEMCSTALLPQHHLVLRICACRAFFNCCDEANNHGIDIGKMCDMKSVISSLVTLGIRSSEEVMNLVFSTLLAVIQANPESVTAESKVVPLCTAALLKYSGDPVIPSHVADIFRALMPVPVCREKIEASVFPTICSIIGKDDRSKLPIRLPAVCLEVLESIVRGSPVPLTDSVVQIGFPATVQCLLTSDDSHTLAAGRECIRAYVSKAADQVLRWNDGVNNGVSLIVKIVCHLLSPSTPELSASMVGRLIFVLLKHGGDAVSPYLEEILLAVLCRMYSCELNCIHQSLIMVFAYLIHYQMDPVLQFLSSVPAPDGSSALQFVMSLWCKKQISFFGSYDQKLSTLALCKIFAHAVSTPDSPLRGIMVQEEVGLKTNSTEMPSQPRMIPLLVKIFKLVIHELAAYCEPGGMHVDRPMGAAGDKLEEDSDEQDTGAGGDPVTHSRDDVNEALRDIVTKLQEDQSEDFSDENDDPDVADDAISKLDLRQELINFLAQLSQQKSYYEELCQHLNGQELAVLSKVKLT